MVTSAVLATMAPADAQDTSRTPDSAKSRERASGDGSDIVVLGNREPTVDEPVTKRTMESSRVGSQIDSRHNFSASVRFARCSIRANMGDRRILRRALDGVINSADQDRAQRRFVQSYFVCAADGELARSSAGLVTSNAFNIDTSGSGTAAPGSPVATPDDPVSEKQYYYDRGAMFIRAIELFSPDVKLTDKVMQDPVVQKRFVIRERPLAAMRVPADRTYFAAAVCLVSRQPELATRLVQQDMSVSTRQNFSGMMINRARSCFGGAKEIYFDPVQLRFYLADALYRWLVAANNLDSLIPVSKEQGANVAGVPAATTP